MQYRTHASGFSKLSSTSRLPPFNLTNALLFLMFNVIFEKECLHQFCSRTRMCMIQKETWIFIFTLFSSMFFKPTYLHIIKFRHKRSTFYIFFPLLYASAAFRMTTFVTEKIRSVEVCVTIFYWIICGAVWQCCGDSFTTGVIKR